DEVTAVAAARGVLVFERALTAGFAEFDDGLVLVQLGLGNEGVSRVLELGLGARADRVRHFLHVFFGEAREGVVHRNLGLDAIVVRRADAAAGRGAGAGGLREHDVAGGDREPLHVRHQFRVLVRRDERGGLRLGGGGRVVRRRGLLFAGAAGENERRRGQGREG